MNELEKNIIEDYPKIGPKLCSIKYKVSYNKILHIRNKFHLQLNRELYRPIHVKIHKNIKYSKVIHKVNEENFISNITKESAYLLGFIWGDGYIINTERQNMIKIECVTEDIDQLRETIDATGSWTYNKRQRPNRKEITLVSTSNKELVEFCIDNDYKNKSKASPNKICSLIPNNLIKYFILGWIDADGCFYRNEKYNTSQLYLSGSYEQDWNFIENFYTKLGIKYKIQRIIRSASKYSCIRVTNKLSIIKIGDIIYSDLIPLKRKYNKYLSIKNYCVTLATQ